MSVTRPHSGPRMSQTVIHGDTIYLGASGSRRSTRPSRATVEARLAAEAHRVEIAGMTAKA